MNCTPDSLMQEAKCFRCIPQGNTSGVITYLMCQWANKPSTPPFTFVPTDIPCLEAWYKLETLDGMYNDGDPILIWPPGFGAKNLTAYDPNGTGVFPLYELAAGPNFGGPDANLAPGGAFEYTNPPNPLEVFMVGFQNSIAFGTLEAYILDAFGGGGVLTFVSYIDSFLNLMFMNLGVNAQSNVNVPAINLIWTTYDFCMSGANSYVQVGANPNTLIPANPGADPPGPSLIIGQQVNFDPVTLPDRQWGGSLADVLIFNCVLTATQRTNLRTYFLNKYNNLH